MKKLKYWLSFDFYLWLIGIILCFILQVQDKISSKTDWIVWKDSDFGVIVEGVLPPFNKNLGLKNQILPGDWLVQIDQKRIYKKEVVDNYIEQAQSGHFYLYFFKRKNKSGDYDTFSVLISVQEAGLWQAFSIPSLWNLFFILLIFLSITSIGLLLIINPFLKTNAENARPLWLANFLSLGIFISILISYLFSFIAPHFLTSFWNQGILIVVFILNFTFWAVLFQINLGKIWLYLIGFHAIAILVVYVFIDKFYILPHTLANLSIFYTCLFWASSKQKYTKITIGLTSLLCIYFFNTSELLWFTHLLTMIFSTGILSYQLLRLGKIGLVVNQSIIYLGTFSFILITFLSIHPIISQYIKDGFYVSLLELIFLSIIVLIVRYLYINNERFVGKYLLSAQKHKNSLIHDFETKITRFTHSDTLLKAFEKLLSEVWNSTKICIFQADNESELAILLRNEFPDKVRIWSSNKLLSAFAFSQALENKLLKEQFQLVVALPFTNTKGFLLLGIPSKNVYTLEDSETLIKICFQVALTLDILQLLENEKLLAQKNLEANLTALRSQINPHFLFNTLNTISALIHDAPDLAEKAVEHLAFIFRYTLKYSSENFVSFKQEIELVSHYLAIEKIRFGKRLIIDIQLDEVCENVMLPAFAIQTAVENCIKHGLSRLTRIGEIKIHIYDTEIFTICTVMDNGVGVDYEKIKKGTGLNNVLTRFETIYHNSHLVSFQNLSETQNLQGTLVEFKIPKN